jgi:uncharacterized Zn finger protein
MWGYYDYVPISQKIENNKKKIEKLKKKDPTISPIVIEGNKISKTWWGIAWNKNLERYADYSNRIGRGRSYVKNGFVVDLKIDVGHVSALVQGSHLYRVDIMITALPKQRWDKIVEMCSHKICSISDLADGKFPKELDVLFTEQGNGLFPTPKEIKFDCNCPDWADMCKHVAAALYAIGAKLDQNPTLFFKLRDIDVSFLIKKSMEEKMENMLKNSDKKTKRVFDDADIGELFGI